MPIIHTPKPQVCRSAALGFFLIASLLAATGSQAEPTTAPSAPAPTLQTDKVLKEMLNPGQRGERPLQPLPSAKPAQPSAGGQLLREGTFIIDRTGRLTRTTDGAGYEFTFDADGRSLGDPPLLILPNLKLVDMEEAVRAQSKDIRFRITGMVTEYRSRNCILVEKVVTIPDVVQQN